MKLPKPWVVSFLGSILILISTFISQYFVFEYEQQIAQVQYNLSILKQRLLSSEAQVWRYEAQESLASIEYLASSGMIVGVGAGLLSKEQFAESNRKAFKAYSLNLTSSAIKLLGLNAEQYSPQEFDEKMSLLKSLGTRLKSLDFNADIEIREQMGKLINQWGETQLTMTKKALTVEDEILSLKFMRNMSRAIGFIFQICGLLVLLLKDLPRQEEQSKSTIETEVTQKVN
jgi:hypothetical protein